MSETTEARTSDNLGEWSINDLSRGHGGHGGGHHGPRSLISGFMEKMFVNAIQPYSKGGATNPIEWSWNLVQQISRTMPSQSVKEFGIRSKVDNNTLLQIDSMTKEGTPRPARWNASWSWPVKISESELYEIWVCRRIIEASSGDPRVGKFVSLLKPTPQQADEATELFQGRIQNSKDINSFITRIGGHLYSVPDAATIDQYLCKEYKPSVQTKVTRMIGELIEERKRLDPNGVPYVPTIADYCAAALQAEEAILDFDTMIAERGVQPKAGSLVAAAVNEIANSGTSNSLLNLVRPISALGALSQAHFNDGQIAENNKGRQEPKTPQTPADSIEKRFSKLTNTIEKLFKYQKKRSRDDDSDEERHRKRGRQTLLSLDKGPRLQNKGTGVCFNCGSTEHRIGDCNKPCRPNITCPKCKKKGHFSRDCPNHKAMEEASNMPRNGVEEIQPNAS